MSKAIVGIKSKGAWSNQEIAVVLFLHFFANWSATLFARLSTYWKPKKETICSTSFLTSSRIAMLCYWIVDSFPCKYLIASLLSPSMTRCCMLCSLAHLTAWRRTRASASSSVEVLKMPDSAPLKVPVSILLAIFSKSSGYRTNWSFWAGVDQIEPVFWGAGDTVEMFR